MVDFEKYVKAIRKDAGDDKYLAWEKAYPRDVMEKLGPTKDEDDPLQIAEGEV
jgi:hypothetical protein